jgi:hypothetical protein
MPGFSHDFTLWTIHLRELFCSHLSDWIFLSVASDTCFLHVSLDCSVHCTLFTWNSWSSSLFLWQSSLFGVEVILRDACFPHVAQLGFFCPLHIVYVELMADFGFLAFFWLSGFLLAFWPSSGFLTFIGLPGLTLGLLACCFSWLSGLMFLNPLASMVLLWRFSVVFLFGLHEFVIASSLQKQNRNPQRKVAPFSLSGPVTAKFLSSWFRIALLFQFYFSSLIR